MCFFDHKMAELPWYQDVCIWLPREGARKTCRLWGTLLCSVPSPSALRCFLWHQGGSCLERKADSAAKRKRSLLRWDCSALWTHQGKIQRLLCWENPFYAKHFLRTHRGKKKISECHLEVQITDSSVTTFHEFKSLSTPLHEKLHTHGFWEIPKC